MSLSCLSNIQLPGNLPGYVATVPEPRVAAGWYPQFGCFQQDGAPPLSAHGVPQDMPDCASNPSSYREPWRGQPWGQWYTSLAG